MGKCPFAFGAAADQPPSACSSDGEEPVAAQQPAKRSGCPLMRPAAAEADDGRFDYQKDPVAWFYQNQIRSEEEFQAKKAGLRAEARRRLDTIFAAKGKHLVIDSDDDDFSIGTSELSAWDSEVHSIHSLASAANSWAEEARFTAPALSTLRVVLLLVLAAAAHCGWQALQAVLHVNRFWGILQQGWVPAAALGLTVAAAAAAGGFWYTTDTKHKHGLLAAQLAMHVLCAAATVVAMLCWVFPSRVDGELRTSACGAGGAERASAASSRLCQYLPMVQEQVSLTMASIARGSALLAAGTLAAACAGTWHFWELAHVEKKAAKHKRRRRHRRRAIPWEKIKIEEMGPVSYCGGGPPRAATTTAAAAAGAPAGAAETKKVV